MNIPIILASKSQARARLLSAAHVDFTQIIPLIDEDAVKASAMDQEAHPKDVCDLLAQMKAQKVSSKELDAFVIGSDQVLELNGEILAKPADAVAALQQLRHLRDKQHQLFTAVCVFHQGRAIWRHVSTARLRMYDVSEDYLKEYVARNWPQIGQCVGSYEIEREGARLFSRIDGDIFSIQGLPLLELLDYLRIRGMIAG